MLVFKNAQRFFAVALLTFMTSTTAAQEVGSKSPKELLQRLDKGVKTNDLEVLQTCIPEQSDEKSKAAAAVVAKRMLLSKQFSDFGKAAQVKFNDRASKVLGVRSYLTLIAIGATQPRMFETLAKQSEIELNEGKNTAVAKTSDQGNVGAMELNLVRKNNHWFVKVDLGLLPNGEYLVVGEYDAARKLLQSCNETLEKATNQQDFQARILKAIETYQAAITSIKQP